MHRSASLWLLAMLPAVPALAYLVTHATEGWQVLVVAGFFLGFVVSWLRTSKTLLLASYLVTASLFAWVLSVNL